MLPPTQSRVQCVEKQSRIVRRLAPAQNGDNPSTWEKKSSPTRRRGSKLRASIFRHQKEYIPWPFATALVVRCGRTSTDKDIHTYPKTYTTEKAIRLNFERTPPVGDSYQRYGRSLIRVREIEIIVGLRGMSFKNLNSVLGMVLCCVHVSTCFKFRNIAPVTR